MSLADLVERLVWWGLQDLRRTKLRSFLCRRKSWATGDWSTTLSRDSQAINNYAVSATRLDSVGTATNRQRKKTYPGSSDKWQYRIARNVFRDIFGGFAVTPMDARAIHFCHWYNYIEALMPSRFLCPLRHIWRLIAPATKSYPHYLVFALAATSTFPFLWQKRCLKRQGNTGSQPNSKPLVTFRLQVPEVVYKPNHQNKRAELNYNFKFSPLSLLYLEDFGIFQRSALLNLCNVLSSKKRRQNEC